MKNPKWVHVDHRLPPDHWMGLVITDVRPDRPVMAHVADGWHRAEFPFADYFWGSWREAILIGDHMREKAKVIMWLETDELYPKIPNPEGEKK